MKRLLLILALALPCFAQQYANILPGTRATTAWTSAGVEGGIPSGSWTQCGSTITAGASATTINNALAACTANHYVLLGAGSFNLSGGLHVGVNNTELRGSGPDQTFITVSADGPTSCHISITAAIALCASASTQHIVNWTGSNGTPGSYAQGSTTVTLSSTSGLVTGTPIILEQADDTTDGWPAAGDLFVCASTSNNCSAQGGGNGTYAPESGRGNAQWVRATNIAGTTVTISPPISLPNYRTGQSPHAVYYDNGVFLSTAGVRNLSLNFTGGQVGIKLVYCDNCWTENVRIINTTSNGSGTPIYDFMPVLTFHMTIRDSYLFGPQSPPGSITNYPLTPLWNGSILWENNILQAQQAALVTNGPYSNSVFGYNFFVGRTGPGVVLHNAGEMMNLVEGNISTGWYADVVHGTHFMETMYRNAMIGHRYNSGSGTVNTAIQAQTNNRFLNVIGNVMGDSYFNTYESTLAKGDTSIYNLGWGGDSSGTAITSDTNVKRTLMRWGNWDSVTNATRWCGNSSDTGWVATCGSTTEIPSGITNFPTPLPTLGDTTAGQSAMPASFYYASTPSWWPGGKAWPPIGPDVTGGNIASMAGHANTNPAADCYLGPMHGPTDGSGSVLTFNWDTMCAAGGAPATQFAPTSLGFGNVNLGSNTLATTVLTNIGSATLNISSTGFSGTNSGDFTLDGSSTCGATLAVAASCNLVVKFTPGGAGTRTGSLNVTDDASGSPQAVGLSGNGVTVVSGTGFGSSIGVGSGIGVK